MNPLILIDKDADMSTRFRPLGQAKIFILVFCNESSTIF